MDAFHKEIIFAVIVRKDDCGCSVLVRLFIYVSDLACHMCVCAPNLAEKFIKMGFCLRRLQSNHLALPNNFIYWKKQQDHKAAEWDLNETPK